MIKKIILFFASNNPKKQNKMIIHSFGEHTQKNHDEVNGLIFLGFVNIFIVRWTHLVASTSESAMNLFGFFFCLCNIDFIQRTANVLVAYRYFLADRQAAAFKDRRLGPEKCSPQMHIQSEHKTNILSILWICICGLLTHIPTLSHTLNHVWIICDDDNGGDDDDNGNGKGNDNDNEDDDNSNKQRRLL